MTEFFILRTYPASRPIDLALPSAFLADFDTCVLSFPIFFGGFFAILSFAGTKRNCFTVAGESEQAPESETAKNCGAYAVAVAVEDHRDHRGHLGRLGRLGRPAVVVQMRSLPAKAMRAMRCRIWSG